MTVEELNIVISANDRKFNEAIGDVIGRLDDLEERSQRTADNAQEGCGDVIDRAGLPQLRQRML